MCFCRSFCRLVSSASTSFGASDSLILSLCFGKQTCTSPAIGQESLVDAHTNTRYNINFLRTVFSSGSRERERESSTTVFRYILLCARIQTFQWSSLCCSSGGVSCTKPTEIIHFAFFWRFDLRTELKSRLFLDYLLFFCQTDRDRWEFILMIWNHCGFVPHKEERWIVK